ncbi:MAG: bifunctional [glutamate--ammonia ligase]-adenylyl-L-tyrosine phosphorylase/[glutamate--ammonia-ligase] adenylyltransferase [Gammaproteobacteria bacterium]|nr:bifunctional [glutamate--ammonia ligase]-adenylyl-L-tyrosine phosphorylase/[glutamate--ammonia-ligase] adenylyltransferase [Gammaproteobacteria bacterium]
MSARLPPVPESLLGEARQALETLPAALREDPRLTPRLLRLFAASPFAADIASRHPGLLQQLLDSGRVDRAAAPGDLAAALGEFIEPPLAETAFMSRLRLFRHRELLRVLWRELEGLATVPGTLRELSDLADACIIAALAWAGEALQARHGRPRLPDGAPCDLGILAMGKLGGRELNFSSDIDLVFVYVDAGQTDGAKPVSNEEYFRLLCQRLVNLLGQPTTEGIVYRVDVRLRPFGNSGPLAVSLPALENYLMQNGRDWERYAYVKARVINEWSEASWFYQDVVRPFVYRRYLDYGVFASLREMKALIETEVRRREFAADIKLGPGGIREIEFIVQSFQLVRGGSVAGLRGQDILGLLPALARHGCLPAAAVDALTAAYLYLRRLENAIQALRDQQTHNVPAEPSDRARLALALGAGEWGEVAAGLERHRATVSSHFHAVVFRGEGGGKAATGGGLRQVWLEEAAPEAAAGLLREAGFPAPEAVLERLRRLRAATSLQRLDAAGRQRLDRLVPALLEAAGRERNALLAIDGVAGVIEAIGRRSAYFALLNENPAARDRLVGMCGLSDFLARQIADHPILLDELLDPRMFGEPPTRAELAGELERRLEAVGGEDPERWLEALRNFQRAAVFRVAVADLSGVLPLMKVSDRLTETAELVLQAACDQAWRELETRHGRPRCVVDGQARPAAFGIVAYGKLGGLELGYASDLDLVFLHDSAGESQQTDGERPLENGVFFVRLARRIISFATMLTPGGHLYEVDTRLQPEGRQGLLVSSLAAFRAYQQQDAWTWEHQALLRSRGIGGDAGVLAAFEAIRREVLTTHVHHERLRADVLEMRERMARELPRGTAESFHIKHDRGGITDIEFIVQYLVLREARHHAELVRWSDNIRQLEALAAAGVISTATAGVLADAYRGYREQLHHLALAGQPGLMPREAAAALAGRIHAIWDEVFAS